MIKFEDNKSVWIPYWPTRVEGIRKKLAGMKDEPRRLDERTLNIISSAWRVGQKFILRFDCFDLEHILGPLS